MFSRPAPVEQVAKARAALAESNKSNTRPKSNTSDAAPFDKAAYQRAYMAKRRAAKKAEAKPK